MRLRAKNMSDGYIEGGRFHPYRDAVDYDPRKLRDAKARKQEVRRGEGVVGKKRKKSKARGRKRKNPSTGTTRRATTRKTTRRSTVGTRSTSRGTTRSTIAKRLATTGTLPVGTWVDTKKIMLTRSGDIKVML